MMHRVRLLILVLTRMSMASHSIAWFQTLLVLTAATMAVCGISVPLHP